LSLRRNGTSFFKNASRRYRMGRVAGKKLFSVMALCAMIGLLLLPIAVSLPSLAIGAGAPDAV
jgi:hypothetical protein